MNTRAVTLADLHEVWRHHPTPHLSVVPAEATASKRIEGAVVIVGAGGGSGATTVALALAQDLPDARLVECRAAPLSTLAAATTAELGTAANGWHRGLREGNHHPLPIQRAPHDAISPAHLPPPEDPEAAMSVSTVLDVGWPLSQLTGWLATAVADAAATVIVAPATCAGLNHLEATVHELDTHTDAPVTAVVRGPAPRRWPRELRASAGPRTQHMLAAGALIPFEEDRSLHLLGLTPHPLPPAVTAAGHELSQHLTPLLPPEQSRESNAREYGELITLGRNPS